MASDKQGVSEIPGICHGHGIRHVVISPGSRSAPLTLAFVSDNRFTCHSIADERSAAYFALGIALQLQQTVALVCTSGTAAANYTPALAEALYQKVPLLVLTADRPPEWIDQNDGQTIRQQNLFAQVVKKSFQTPVDTTSEPDLWFFGRIINEALGYCRLEKPGPVHVNIPLREPLYNPLPPARKVIPIIRVTEGAKNPDTNSWEQLRQQWESLPKKLIVCGQQHQHNKQLNQLLATLARDNRAVVMAENLSNLQHEHFIGTPEIFMASLDAAQREAFQPDLLITLGGPILSKRLKKHLRRYAPKQHWHVDEHELFVDTFCALNHNIMVQPGIFFENMAGLSVHDPSWCKQAEAQLQQLSVRQDAFVSTAAFSDLAAYRAIFAHMPANCNLHLANSTPVRYAQLFPSRPDIRYFSNRGTSGIDGCVSTAAGAASISDQLNILLLGDLAFVYDSNGLWNNHLPANLRIVVIDNGGGNIFKLIDTGPEVEKIRPFIETPHHTDIKSLCRAYGTDYLFAGNSSELNDLLPRFFKPNARPLVLHIQTPGDDSADIFKQYFQHISNNNEHDKKLDNTEGIQ